MKNPIWFLPILVAGFGVAVLGPGDPEAAPANPRTIVLCAPGYPGNTAQAQPTMDAFARGLAKEAGWPEVSLSAIYYETADGGLARFAQQDAAIAIVPLSFYLEYGVSPDTVPAGGPAKRKPSPPKAGIAFDPRLAVVQESGVEDVWSILAKKGMLDSADSLAGWELTGVPGYSPAFVSSVAFRDWGAIPKSARITFTPRILTALRRAASGEKVAVIADKAQTDALPTLPFASDLAVVTRSKPLPSSLVCVLGDRMGRADSGSLLLAMARLQTTPEGAGILKAMRIARFAVIDPKAIEPLRAQFRKGQAAATPPAAGSPPAAASQPAAASR